MGKKGIKLGDGGSIYIAALSRGGSNVLSALLHNHENLYVIAKRHQKELRNDDFLEYISKTKKSIYFRGGFKKDMSKIKFYVFDKYLEYKFNLKCRKNDFVITSIRNPFAITNSMDQFGKKYDFDTWKQDEKTVEQIIGFRFARMIRNCVGKNKIIVFFDDLINNYNKVLSNIYKNIGVRDISHISFKNVFETNKCCYCGGEFTIKETDCVDASTALTVRKLKFPSSAHFFCENDNCFTLGYGGFNPCREIIKPEPWESNIQQDLYEYVYSNLSKSLGENLAKKFANNSVKMEDIRSVNKKYE